MSRILSTSRQSIGPSSPIDAPVIFLDVDGVLNTSATSRAEHDVIECDAEQSRRVDAALARRLVGVVRATRARVVLERVAAARRRRSTGSSPRSKASGSRRRPSSARPGPSRRGGARSRYWRGCATTAAAPAPRRRRGSRSTTSTCWEDPAECARPRRLWGLVGLGECRERGIGALGSPTCESARSLDGRSRSLSPAQRKV